jgi:4-carboxymuconolactone decarboxylase
MIQSSSHFEEMIKSSQKMVKAIISPLGSFSASEAEVIWPTMPKGWMEMMFGNALNQDGLDAKPRPLLIWLGSMIQGAKNETALRRCARHLLEVDVKVCWNSCDDLRHGNCQERHRFQ